ncbi:glycosyltransferase family 4 protein [Photobacterium lipolyticum]|uniref:Uncharacterized protein n=1 Tax=Photobacterium lipolyticum TaxID=266810 RepID=A0A2T3MV59_9GAMM|nr:glycosyltransferase [Photobacterium lipolyticum]PSW03860.1 hypothetical protein C9I89_15830 [Photobacterium lipolyticum]
MKLEGKKVILVLGGLDTSGGMFNYLKAWINEHNENGADVGVCAIPEVLEKLDDVDRKIALPYHENEDLKKIYLSLINGTYADKLNDIRKEVEKIDVDFLHFVDETIFYPYLKKIAKSIPHVITVHDPIYHPGQFKKITTRILCLVSRLSYFTSRKLTIHLHSKRNIFPSILFFYKRKVHHHHPLPKRIFNSDVITNRNPIIAFMGRIEKYKGIDLFIDSIKFFEDTYKKEIEVMIIGNGNFNKQSLNKISYPVKIENRFVEDIEFHKFMSQIDVLVLPYLSATQSGVGYLAKSYNKKIICTNVGNLPDLIENESQGYVVNKTKESIAKAINEIIKYN